MSESDLLNRWLIRARTSSFAHYAAQERYAALHRQIGIPAAVLSAVVGSTVFASLQADVGFTGKIVVGGLSIVAAVLTGLQTFLKFSDIAESHRKSAGEYAAIRRRIEELLTISGEIKPTIIESIRKDIDSVSKSSLNVSKGIFDTARRRAGTEFFKPTTSVTVRPPAQSASSSPSRDIGFANSGSVAQVSEARAFPREGPTDD